MTPWKSLLLNAYYHGSRPLRWWRRRCMEAAHHAPVTILFYHRIADDMATPWTTSRTAFEHQIHWLMRNFELVSLEEARRRIAVGDNSSTCVSITFDDGYADNCESAIPLLVRYRIPCTYFVTVENVLYEKPFAHDQKLGCNFQPNTLEQLRSMAAAGVEIGSHSYSHANIGLLEEPHMIYREVVVAGDELQQAIGRRVRYFAFPFGSYANLHPLAFRMAKEAGYEAVCSAYGGYNFPGDDPFHLQRVHGDETIRLKNWVTYDARKARVPRFEYEWIGAGPACHAAQDDDSLPNAVEPSDDAFPTRRRGLE